MSTVFKSLERRIIELIKDKLKLGSLTVSNIQEICKIHSEFLKANIDCLSRFMPSDLELLRQKYFNAPGRNENPDPRPIIMELKTSMRGKAGLLERAMPFGAALQTSKKYLKLMDEISKHAKELVGSDGSMTIDRAKITDVCMLGVLRECDLFVKYTSFLWEYFRIVIDNARPPKPYRVRFLLDHQEEYMDIMMNVCEQQANYTFMNEIEVIKRKNADLLLYANKSSFLPFLHRSNYNASNEMHITHGVIGFNVFSLVASIWEDWKYNKYKKAKVHREWMQQEEYRLKQILAGQDENSPAAKQTAKYIEVYSAEIAELDKKISEYEGVE